MRRLMLLRHAKTERAGPGERDRDRELTKRGRADASAVATYMTHNDLVPDLALVSPARRTQQTWDLVSAVFDKTPRRSNEDRIYNASTDELMALVGETRGAPSLLAIGHNPGFHDLALQLIGSGDAKMRTRLLDKLPTSGLVVIDLPFDNWSQLRPQCGRLVHYMTPRLLDETL
jgi:phosphohistidine phosphatase